MLGIKKHHLENYLDFKRRAEEMGIEVREKKSGWHTIIEDDKEVLLDINKHLKLP